MLKFNSDGRFTIMAFGDMHESNNFDTDGALRFGDAMALMNAALDRVKPDLCVYMGDNCSTRGLDTPEGVAAYRKTVEAITAPVRSRGIPFATVIGNHGHDHGYEDTAVEVYKSLDCSLVRNDAPEITGNANYTEQIMSSDGERIAYNIWFMDSNNLGPSELVSKYDWVKDDQIAWYEKKAEELKKANGGKTVPAILFQHMPVCEEYNLLRKASFFELPGSVTGCNLKRNYRYVLQDGVEGYLGEGPCSPDFNNGQFASWKKTGDIVAAVFGHDHMNDFCGEVDGIKLMQCKTAGFGCYTDGCNGGVRVITLSETEPRKIETKMLRFKELGLKAKCLNFEFRHFHDRQSIRHHICSRIAAVVAVPVTAGIAVKHIRRK